MRFLANADDALLKAAGYGNTTAALAMATVFRTTCDKIETMIRKWERANPDS